jgi:hypothetical protein
LPTDETRIKTLTIMCLLHAAIRLIGAVLKEYTVEMAMNGGSHSSAADVNGSQVRVEPSGPSYWKREILAYQSGLLADLPAGFRAPRCFGSVEHPGGGWLWLEDISDMATDRWSRERFTAAAHRLGAFSAAYLTGRPLPTYPWLSQSWFRGNVARAAGAVALLPSLVDHPFLAPALPGRRAQRVLQLINEAARLLDALDVLPQTFCHMDPFPRNILVRNQDGLDGQFVLIDWDSAGVNALGADLAALVGGSLLWRRHLVAVPSRSFGSSALR